MLVIYKKELKSYFNGMMGYVFIAFALAVIGVYTVAVSFLQSYPNFEYVLDSVRFLFVLIIPVLTMRTMAEEKRQRTDQLLYSSPVSTTSIITGKFLAALTVFAVPLLISCAYPVLLGRFGIVNYKTAYAGILGFLLMGGAAIAIGIFLSALAESQMVSAVVSFACLLGCYLMPSLTNMLSSSALTSALGFAALFLLVAWMTYNTTRNVPLAAGVGVVGIGAMAALYMLKPAWLEGTFNTALNSLAVFSRYDTFVYGMFDLRSVVYFVTIIALFIFFTVQTVEKRRWA
ncbi:MAG: ABC transporter permease [Clostridia bacterium]|nr:ABC transporter permease [Clostridia bacterium]